MSYSDTGYPRPRRRGCGCAVVSLLVLVVLVLAAAVAGEFYVRDQMESKIASAATDELHSPTTATIEGLALLALATDKASSVHLTSEGGTSQGEVAPAVDVTLKDVTLAGDSATAADLQGTVTLSAQDMLAAATDAGSGNSGDFLSQFTQVQDIRPNPGAGALDVQIGGVATAQLVPEVKNGQLEFAPKETQVFGIQIPDNVLGGTISMANQAIEKLPPGVTITGAKVTDKGLELGLTGKNVSLRKSGS